MITDTVSAIAAISTAGDQVKLVALGIAAVALIAAGLLWSLPYGWRYFKRILGR